MNRDASIRYSGSVSAPIRSFSADRVSERRDRSKSDIVCILLLLFSPTKAQKHYKAPLSQSPSVLKPFHSLM